MHWNGYNVSDSDGAILLQCEQLALVDWMSLVMPGQKIDASAFDVIADVPWHVEQIGMKVLRKVG